MAADERLGQAKFATQLAHLVLEQFAQRLDELHLHPLGQAADIVVAFDRHRWPAGEADAFDDVRIQRALRQEVRATDFVRLLIATVDEGLDGELALALRIANALPSIEETRHGLPDRKNGE